MTLRVMIVDDEPLARENVRMMLEHRPGVQVVAEACDVQSARECLLRCEVDLVFLDIRMPGASGLELAAGLRVHEAPLVVVVTAHAEFAVEAFGVRAADFLLKPFDESRLAAALDLVVRRHAERASFHALAATRGLANDLRVNPGSARTSGDRVCDGDRLVIRDRRRVVYVPLDEIVHCRSARNYIRVHTPTRWHLLRLPLTTLVGGLDPERFVQVHRTALVNIRHVTELAPTVHGDYIVRLSTGSKVRLSRRRRAAIERLVSGHTS